MNTNAQPRLAQLPMPSLIARPSLDQEESLRDGLIEAIKELCSQVDQQTLRRIARCVVAIAE